MGESHHQATSSSRLGIRSTVGEIVEVQGGHIVRATGRKDRHSKVCTAKGPRDRRVRLSAHTAIQFYDVQDRLGYDRPSKAVDWLIKKAKAAIDDLAELPTWNPTSAAATTTRATGSTQQQEDQTSNETECQFSMENLTAAFCTATGSGNIGNRRTIQTSKATKTAATTTRGAVASHVPHMQERQQIAENRHHHNRSSSLLPQSLDSDAIADTIKTFFPMGGSADQTTSSSLQFQSYSPDLLSRTSSQTQDLRLSLQSFPEPIQQVLFSGTSAARNALSFDGASVGWSEHHQQQGEESRFQRMVAWNTNNTAADADADADTGNGGGGGAGGGSGGGFIFNPPPPVVSPPQPPLLQPLFGQTQSFSQRGPLQSSYTPSVRAWMDPAITVAHHHHFQEIPQINQDQSGISGIGFSVSSGGGGGRFPEFCFPSRIQGEEEEHVGIPNRPSSTSSDSHH